MQRRQFLKISPVLLSSLALWSCFDNSKTYDFVIEVLSDRPSGHLLFADSRTYPIENTQTQTLIVGGGVAGITSAYQFRNKDFLLCEVSKVLGGTSSKCSYQDLSFSQGAHYEVYYPKYFGKEVLSFLEKLNIIYFNRLRDAWEFVDRQFLISGKREEAALVEGRLYDSILPANSQSADFINGLEKFVGTMKLPTREIDRSYHYLNNASFLSYLKSKDYKLSDKLVRAINYRMLDDFGGSAEQVSALAGVYYYTSRPFEREDSHIFSPPQGNFYFIEKMLLEIPKSQVLTRHLVKRIIPKKTTFEVDVLDIENQVLRKIHTQQIIFAANKHTLKYVFPQDYALFQNTEYTPWLVLNIVFKDEGLLPQGFWQNEILDKSKMPEDNFLGFIDSGSQDTYQSKRVLTAYYCLSTLERKDLIEIERKPESIVELTLEKISYYFDINPQHLEANISKAFVKIMGHAMPLPKPKYLFTNPNSKRKHHKLVYAGVDTGRLPLLLEAIDSGLEAFEILDKQS